jgi:glycosyltransferase involved in cell wall biosynthesis
MVADLSGSNTGIPWGWPSRAKAAMMEENIAAGEARQPRRLRVVMVIQRFRPYFSGHGVQVELLSRELVRRGAEVTVVAAIRSGDAPLEEQGGGVRIRRLRCDLPGGGDSRLRQRLWSPAFALRTAAFLSRNRHAIDLVHVHGANDALYAAWAFGRIRGLPVLLELTLMGADDPETLRTNRNLLSPLRYAIYRRLDGYVAISPMLADAYRRAGLPESRLRTIPQGVDLARYRPSAERPALRGALGVDGDDPLLVFLGSLLERKGIDVLLSAWAQIHAARPSARLWLVGRDRFADDPAAEEFLERCQAALPRAAQANLRRLGVRDDPERFLQAADAFLFPSRREGFGTAIVEAMACAVPCVVAELPGITDFIFAAPARGWPAGGGPTPEGIVVPQEDPAALAEAALALLTVPERASQIGAAARVRARERFGIDQIADEYLSWYGELLGSYRRAAP